jgi:hypothetical protein
MIAHTGGLCAALSGLVMYCVAIITQGVALGSYVSRRWRSRLPEQLLKGHNATGTRLSNLSKAAFCQLDSADFYAVK